MSTLVRRRHSSEARLAACLGAVLALTGCTKTKGDGVVPPDGTGPGGAVTGPAGAIELAPVEQVSQLLPRGTALLVTGTSVTRAAEVLERNRLVEAFGPQYTSLRSVIVGAMGHDLLDPAQWPAVGLDPGGTVGLAVTNLHDPRLVLFATVSDRAKLVAFVRQVAGKAEVEIVEEPYGSASILRPKGEDDGVVVLRDRFAALVMDGGKGAHDLAKLIVTMDPNVSLASQAAYRKATGGLRAADMTAYLDVAGMVDQANSRDEERDAQPSANWAQEELVRAKKEGAPPERLAELERQAAQMQAQEASWRERAQAERALAELVVSGIEGVGLTATVKRSGPVFDGRVVAGPEAFLRRLLVNRQGAPTLPVAMNGAPVWCVGGRIDPAAGLELAEAIAAADGADRTQMRAGTKRTLGIDVEADLVPVLAGDAELCAAFEGTPGEGRMDPRTQLGLGAIVRTTDAAKAKYVLAKIATSSGELAKRMKKRGEGYAVEVPDWRTLHVQAVGDRVVVSTDPELAKRLGAGDPGSMPSKIRPPAATGAIGLQGTAVTNVSDLSLAVLWTMMGRSSMGEAMVVGPGLTPEQMEKVPLSAKSKKAKKAMQKAKAQVDALEAKREAVEIKEVLGFTDGLGLLVTAATEDDRGFTLTGGQFLRAESLGRVLEAMLRAATGERGVALPPAEQKALEEAWQRWSDAQRVYTDARMEDAQRFVEKRLGGPVPKGVPMGVPTIRPGS
jgi:hypothetical protein